MIFFFGGIAIALILWQIRDEFRHGGSLSLTGERAHIVGDLLEFPLSGDWTHDDVIRTYAEIESL